MISNTYTPAKTYHLANGSILLRDDILNYECCI